MMKSLFYLALSVVAIGCKAPQTAATMNLEPITKQQPTNDLLATTTDGDLIGKERVQSLLREPFRSWFAPGYDNYKPDAETISKLKSLTSNISVTIFMGTWCGDSKEQVPHFYKVLHEAGFDEKNVTLIMVDRDKTTPEKLENGLNITNVPTFIFYKTTHSRRKKSETEGESKTKELNRIVESPRETLEMDMLKILSGQAYKNTYAP